MATLHTVNKSPFERPALESCLAYALPGSAVLLIEDGVYAARAGTPFERVLAGSADVAIFALAPDLAARGIDENTLVPGVRTVGYDGFVDLAAAYDKVQSWL